MPSTHRPQRCRRHNPRTTNTSKSSPAPATNSASKTSSPSTTTPPTNSPPIPFNIDLSATKSLKAAEIFSVARFKEDLKYFRKLPGLTARLKWNTTPSGMSNWADLVEPNQRHSLWVEFEVYGFVDFAGRGGGGAVGAWKGEEVWRGKDGGGRVVEGRETSGGKEKQSAREEQNMGRNMGKEGGRRKGKAQTRQDMEAFWAARKNWR
ncbi:hypothetical protein CC80DRAFT_547141 [Byssothecium circinans]|uniref:Uncharacterized protein n=1 Tax=Byssothecium circinans TaxID=147558 RepID=A0A6A5U2M4_9PLEO|nr:hypothetical protein CC80DRAFT_547141 [Byssothecium circinans]